MKKRAVHLPDQTPYELEEGRIAARRRELGLDDHPAGGKHWGLALSGGGIRSATFSLGVMQGLARSPVGGETSATRERPLLWYFDYLSTVSGGGYAGAFFCSLFVPGRLQPGNPAGATPKGAATLAYEVLRYEPPGRFRTRETLRPDAPGEVPLSWLRENGRYLTPTGGGDLVYAASVAIRNWVSLHYVLGTVLMMAFAFIALARAYAMEQFDGYRALENMLFTLPACDPCTIGELIWWSPLGVLPIAWTVLFAVPVGVAFWLAVPEVGQTPASPVKRFNTASAIALFGAALFTVISQLLSNHADWEQLTYWTRVIAFVAALSVLAHWLTIVRERTIATQRVKTTRLFALGVEVALALAFLALVDTAGQTLYRLLQAKGSPLWHYLSPAALVGVLVWLTRQAATFFDEKDKGWIAKIPMPALAAGVGTVMLFFTATFWQLLVHWVQWHGTEPTFDGLVDPERTVVLAVLFGVAFLFAFGAGLFPAFINASSLQAFYGARLTRAYLGASNGARFGANAKAGLTVAEPDPGDDLTHGAYYAKDVLAPLHVINVTMNQTVDPGEQLVQRDRKGKPLAVLPQGFSIDGRHFEFKEGYTVSEAQLAPTISGWVSASGAAFTTGLGRATSFGTSLALGLANVRLGSWWGSGAGTDRARGVERLSLGLFKSQTYLGYELLARFQGLRREWQYLSDGGHFENTALYELVRPERHVELMVVCDDGCDCDYSFGDLGNLVRLARIDHRVEVEVDHEIARRPGLSEVFGTVADFAPPHGITSKCALLLVCRVANADGSSHSRVIVLLKPRLIAGLPVDVQEYAHSHPRFPQEPTADQFFNEAQWESYRKLGLEIARRVFDGATGAALWDYLRGEYGIGEGPATSVHSGVRTAT